MRVVASQLHMKYVSVSEAKKQVLDAALDASLGDPTPETQRLLAKLKQVTGATIGELAVLAKDWPDA